MKLEDEEEGAGAKGKAGQRSFILNVFATKLVCDLYSKYPVEPFPRDNSSDGIFLQKNQIEIKNLKNLKILRHRLINVITLPSKYM